MKTVLSNTDVLNRARMMANDIRDSLPASFDIYPIPRGGIPAAYAALQFLPHNARIVENPEDATIFVDDIIDSGRTLEQWSDDYPGRLFVALVDKQGADKDLGWIVFPWEGNDDGQQGIDDTIRRLMQFIGENPDREGLQETPIRVAKALKHWYSGYDVDPASVLKVFEDGAEGCDEMVVVQDIPFFSHCEHHMAPIVGTATIGYIPNGKIIGLSKLPRLLDIFARRMQVQERLTTQVADTLADLLQPLGCGVIIKARHLCMESRGIEKIGSVTITSALRGVFKENPSSRAEFLSLGK